MCDRRDAQGAQASERHTVVADNRDIGGHVKPPIGDRGEGDSADYPADDLAAVAVDGGWIFTHKDGSPY